VLGVFGAANPPQNTPTFPLNCVTPIYIKEGLEDSS
jgi:hypothetical protein